MGAMRVAGGRNATIVALLLWVLAGPLAAAFGPCASMGMMCEGTCGAATCPASVSGAPTVLLLIAEVAGLLLDEPARAADRTPDPPPKPSRPAA
jgi:hypothetical protein